MPYIRLSVTKKLTDDQTGALVHGLGESMRNIPGKDEKFLIVDVEDERKIFFGGAKQENMAFADIRYVSKYDFQKKQEFTKAVFETINKVLCTDMDKMCLTITEFDNWGAVGDFRDVFYTEFEGG